MFLTPNLDFYPDDFFNESQSLIHQVFVPNAKLWAGRRILDQELVAIPYSSGLCFQRQEAVMKAVMELGSQSLIHQVSVSNYKYSKDRDPPETSRNPLFIRSMFLTFDFLVCGLSISCRNPLFIRSLFPTLEERSKR